MLAPEFHDELVHYGHIYMYRFRPTFVIFTVLIVVVLDSPVIQCVPILLNTI